MAEMGLNSKALEAATAAVTAEIDRYWKDDTIEPGHGPVAEAAIRAYLAALGPQPVSVAIDDLDQDKAVRWPPLKKALWKVVTDEQLNDGHYVNAYRFTDALYKSVAALAPVIQAVPGDMVLKSLRHISRIAQDRTEHAHHRIDAIIEIADAALAGQVSLPASGRQG